MNSCIIFKENYVPSKTVDRSILHGECIDLFRAAIKSPSTRDPYERLISYLHILINMNPKTKRIRTQGSMDAQSTPICVRGCDSFLSIKIPFLNKKWAL